jgi:beta-galactosidase
MWDGWVDVELPRVHLLGHWNYAAGTRKAVHAVSGAERVEFFLNGRSLGFGTQSNRFQFTLADVAWQPGELRAVGYDSAGKILCEDQRVTAGEPHALRLTATTGPGGLRADGADLALVEVEVVDAAGRRCPTALHPVDFTLTGPAEWRGGIAQGPGNHILSRRLPVECGVNRVLVRSQTTAGQIVLTAAAGGLEPAQLVLTTSVPTPFAEANLPANLSRGPTPEGPSFRPIRTAVHPTGMATADHSAKAPLSCDDDETTAWASPLALEQAWIDYSFGREVTLTAIDVKVVNARYRSYPVRVTVDGTEVFTGNTPMGQGYVTLPLRPVRGRVVRLALTDAPLQNDSQRLFELSEKPPALQEGIRRVAPSLGIVEADFHESTR